MLEEATPQGGKADNAQTWLKAFQDCLAIVHVVAPHEFGTPPSDLGQAAPLP